MNSTDMPVPQDSAFGRVFDPNVKYALQFQGYSEDFVDLNRKSSAIRNLIDYNSHYSKKGFREKLSYIFSNDMKLPFGMQIFADSPEIASINEQLKESKIAGRFVPYIDLFGGRIRTEQSISMSSLNFAKESLMKLWQSAIAKGDFVTAHSSVQQLDILNNISIYDPDLTSHNHRNYQKLFLGIGERAARGIVNVNIGRQLAQASSESRNESMLLAAAQGTGLFFASFIDDVIGAVEYAYNIPSRGLRGSSTAPIKMRDVLANQIGEQSDYNAVISTAVGTGLLYGFAFYHNAGLPVVGNLMRRFFGQMGSRAASAYIISEALPKATNVAADKFVDTFQSHLTTEGKQNNKELFGNALFLATTHAFEKFAGKDAVNSLEKDYPNKKGGNGNKGNRQIARASNLLEDGQYGSYDQKYIDPVGLEAGHIDKTVPVSKYNYENEYFYALDNYETQVVESSVSPSFADKYEDAYKFVSVFPKLDLDIPPEALKLLHKYPVIALGFSSEASSFMPEVFRQLSKDNSALLELSKTQDKQHIGLMVHEMITGSDVVVPHDAVYDVPYHELMEVRRTIMDAYGEQYTQAEKVAMQYIDRHPDIQVVKGKALNQVDYLGAEYHRKLGPVAISMAENIRKAIRRGGVIYEMLNKFSVDSLKQAQLDRSQVVDAINSFIGGTLVGSDVRTMRTVASYLKALVRKLDAKDFHSNSIMIADARFTLDNIMQLMEYAYGSEAMSMFSDIDASYALWKDIPLDDLISGMKFNTTVDPEMPIKFKTALNHVHSYSGAMKNTHKFVSHLRAKGYIDAKQASAIKNNIVNASTFLTSNRVSNKYLSVDFQERPNVIMGKLFDGDSVIDNHLELIKGSHSLDIKDQAVSVVRQFDDFYKVIQAPSRTAQVFTAVFGNKMIGWAEQISDALGITNKQALELLYKMITESKEGAQVVNAALIAYDRNAGGKNG
ncbi:MAG: hypothetical protein ACRCX2_04895 [Paraclostridium sp.]